ncbi:hypothetical protein AB6A40_008408 [Gnathostoma spinigerum]|uniref:3-hydroxyisobutyrate dehydrogenase n=1 Tax=Gnathostoma spinigerum TaxID=75299 RepID=A0ABD6EU42_9BILA
MLPESDHVRSVFCDKDGILRSIKPGTLCIDTSTIDQKVSIELAELVRKKDSEYIDAPVSGGVVGAENATLTFMVGGSDVAFKRACELLKHMGKTFTHCGKVGDGQAAKICNNMLLGITMIGVSEAMNLGIRMGLDKKLLASIINSSSGRCWSSDTYNPVPGIIDGLPSSKDYTGGFACALMAKDLGLAQTAAVSTRSPIPLGSLAHQMYRILSKKSGDKDMGYVYKMLSDEQ